MLPTADTETAPFILWFATIQCIQSKQEARVTVDTTVQPKAITFPTDAKLLHAAMLITRYRQNLHPRPLEIDVGIPGALRVPRTERVANALTTRARFVTDAATFDRE